MILSKRDQAAKLVATDRAAKAARFRMWARDDGLYDHLAELKDQYVTQLTELPAGQTDAIIGYKHAIRVIEIVKMHIESTIASGELAVRELKKIDQIGKGERKRFF